MESHIVTAVAKGEAPKDWGCDAVWDGGEANLEKCIAVFGTIYIMSDTSKSPVYLDYLLENFPQIAGALSLDRGQLFTFFLHSVPTPTPR